jgi:sulfite reductase alpha subunit-like flavoprotein
LLRTADSACTANATATTTDSTADPLLDRSTDSPGSHSTTAERSTASTTNSSHRTLLHAHCTAAAEGSAATAKLRLRCPPVDRNSCRWTQHTIKCLL